MGNFSNLYVGITMILILLLSRGCFAVDVVKVLQEGRTYKIFTGLITASRLDRTFSREAATVHGVTLFAPTDEGFCESNKGFQSLVVQKKIDIIGLHILRTYLPLDKLPSFDNPIQSTLTSGWYGQGLFQLNITKFNASSPIRIQSSLVSAKVTQILYQRKRVAIFGISRLLLPKETFDITDEL